MFQRLTRRNLLVVGLGTVAGAALAACGSNQSASPSSGSPAAAPTTASSSGSSTSTAAQPTQAAAPAAQQPASGATVTLRQMRFAGVGWEQDVKFAEDFAKKNPNVKVVGEDTPYAQMNQKVLTTGAAGTIGDLFPGHVRWAGYWKYKAICHELDALAKTYADETKFDDFFPSVIKDALGPGANGKLYVFPTIVHPGGNAVVMINLDLVEKAGLKPPAADSSWTIKDMEALARGAGKPKDGIFGLEVTMDSPLYSTQVTRGYSGVAGPPASDDSWVLSPDGKKSQLNSGPVKEAFEWYQKLVKDGFSPTSQNKLPGSTGDLFTAGKEVMQAQIIGQPQADHDIIKDKFKWTAVLWPKGPNGCRGSCLSYNLWAMSAKTKNPDVAFHLLNALTGTEAGTWASIQGHAVPYARNSVWSNPDLWKAYPIDQQGADWFKQGVDPFPMPDNLRAQEYQDTFQQNITPYLDGKQTWDEMFNKVQSAVQGILDQPKP